MYITIVDLALVMWALWQFSSLRSNVPYRKAILIKSIPKFGDYFIPSIGVGFLSIGWRSEFLCQSRLWRSQVWDLRRFLFSSAQTLFSFFWILFGFAIFYEMSSYLLVAVALSWLGLHFLLSKSLGQRSKAVQIFSGLSSSLYFALVLFFLDQAFRNSTILMQFLMDSETVFFTTIDSLANIAILLVLATAIGFFVPIQGWSLVLSFVLFLNSQLSYLGCAFVIVGEFLGIALYLFWRIRLWDTYYRKRVSMLFGWIFVYVFVFLVGVFVLRQFMSFGNIFNQLFVLKWIYLTTVMVFLVGLYLTILISGHFAFTRQEKDVASSDSSLVQDFETEELDDISIFIADQLRLRKDKLIVFKSEMESDPQSKSKIPPFVLGQFQAETTLIENVLRVFSSRS